MVMLNSGAIAPLSSFCLGDYILPLILQNKPGANAGHAFVRLLLFDEKRLACHFGRLGKAHDLKERRRDVAEPAALS